MIGKNLNTQSPAKNGLSKNTSQTVVFANELLSFLREVKFNKLEFSASKSISDIKYYYLGFQNNNFFYQINY